VVKWEKASFFDNFVLDHAFLLKLDVFQEQIFALSFQVKSFGNLFNAIFFLFGFLYDGRFDVI
jgi:hypothetical protein